MITNRAKGWKHAKITGHVNEDLVAQSLGFLYQTRKQKVKSIFEEKTIPKRDLYGPQKISLKKSPGGQAFLTKPNKFISAFEILYCQIPYSVKECLYLLFGGHPNIKTILSDPLYIHDNSKIYETEKKRGTLCVESIKKYNPQILKDCIDWFHENIENIVEIVFSRGYASESEDFAEILMYRNELGENKLNQTFDISVLKEKCVKNPNISFGEKNGGTTLNLPFGHLQYHQKMMQFHHNYDKINLLFNENI